MSTVKELYDNAFLRCIKNNIDMNTDDNYDNPEAHKEVALNDNVESVYKEELKNSLDKMKLFHNLDVLFSSTLKFEAAQQIWSYILYLRILEKNPTVVKCLNKLYNHIKKDDQESIRIALKDTIDIISNVRGECEPDAYNFFKQLSSCIKVFPIQ